MTKISEGNWPMVYALLKGRGLLLCALLIHDVANRDAPLFPLF